MFKTWPVQRYRRGEWEQLEDKLGVEQALDIRLARELGSQSLALTMRSPVSAADDVNLARGYALSSGLIQLASDLVKVHSCGLEKNTVVLTVRNPQLSRGHHGGVVSSSCGLCGVRSEDVLRLENPYSRNLSPNKLTAEFLRALPQVALAGQTGFANTGGLHGASLFDRHGRLLAQAEDIGRHNAMDKVIGWSLSQGLLPLSGYVILLSSRIGFELVQKAALAGLSTLVALGAPTLLACRLAKSWGIQLGGFLGTDKINLYT